MKKTAAVLGVGVWLGVWAGLPAWAQEPEPASQARLRQRADDLYNRADDGVLAKDYAGALRYFEQALPLYREAGDRVGEAMALYRSGLMREQLEGCQAALPTYQQALPLLQAIPRPEWEGRAWYSVANCQLQAGNAQEALDHFQHAIPVLEATQQRLQLAMSLSAVGILSKELGQVPRALDALKRAAPLFHAEGMPLLEANAYLGVAAIHDSAWEHALARESYEKALALVQAAGERRLEAELTRSLGSIAIAQGRFQEGLVHYQRAISLYEALREPGAKAQIELDLGSFYQQLGDHALALQYFQRAHDSWGVAGKQPPLKLEASSRLENLGGQMGAIIRNSHREFHPTMQLLALKLMGGEQASLGQWAEARRSYERALTLTRAAKDVPGEADVQMKFASLHEAQGDALEAVRCYERARVLYRSVGDKSGEADAIASGVLLMPALKVPGEATKGLAYLEKLVEQVKHPQLRFIVLARMAIAYERLGDLAGAMRCYQREVEVLERSGEPHRVADVLIGIGLTHEQLGEESKALEAYEKAIAVIEPVRARAGVEEVKTRIASDAWLAYEQAIQLRLRRREVAKAFELSERGRSRAFLDVLGSARPASAAEARDSLISLDQALAEKLATLDRQLAQERSRSEQTGDEQALTALEEQRAALRKEADDLLLRLRATHPRYASLQSVETLGVAEVQKLLDARTTLVSYVNLDKVVAFVITRDSLRAVELPLTSEELRELVPGAMGLLASENPDINPQKALEKLHAKLVAPLVPHLKTPRVGLIPHGVLHYLPFAALSDGRKYLGDRYTLFTLPGASALRYLPKARRAEGPALVLAQGKAEGASVLDSVDAEALSIARLYGVEALTRAAATEAALKQGASKASLLHVAAHGELDPESPLFSRLLLAPGGGEDGALTVGEVYGLDLSASRLVVLSACQTNVGKQSQGDEVVGLTRAFFYAQAPAVLASLWKVDDEATGVLMTEFHSQLQKGKGKAEALREAQARTRARFPHPHYWAAFVLTGDPG
ncbi:MAG TPA: CHAT domain-containing protein [Archangium sp.]|nr:CHAT domain-containing protein [Archangium sp.]